MYILNALLATSVRHFVYDLDLIFITIFLELEICFYKDLSRDL